jgi:hypothetical protein
MNPLLVLAIVLSAAAADKPAARAPEMPFESRSAMASQGKIDELVFAKLKHLGISPAPVCSDAVFIRRAYLDVIGTLPTAAEAKEFLADGNPRKRKMLIDRLLERKEFADYWAMKWCDLLRVKSEYPINLWPNAVQTYHHWIWTCIRDNKPYDRFVREMLTANGSNFNVPQVNFLRAVQGREPAAIAQAVALSFMGVRANAWPKERWAEMALFFSQIQYKTTEQWKEEIVLFDPGKGLAPSGANQPARAVFPDGTTALLQPGKDPREVFADWLISDKNPYFARNIVNRAWSWFLGRGIIHEPDDIRDDNLPFNAALLAYLEKELRSSHYDLKHIFRLILNSKTYQLSSISESEDPVGEANFSHYPMRRLQAEVLIDAIDQITGTTENYSSPIPEPFTFIPEDQRSIALADGSISSSFLEMFGRPSRDTGLESERNNNSTAFQELHLLNSSHIRNKIERSKKISDLLQAKYSRPRDVVDEIYLTILSRYPTDDELIIVRNYSQPPRPGRRPMIDVVWALINSAEFLYKH